MKRYVESLGRKWGVFCVSMLLCGASDAAPVPSPAQALFASGDFAAARNAYAREVARNPKDIEAILGLARVQLYQNQLDKAEGTAHKVLALDPGSDAAKRILAAVAQRRAVLASAAQIKLPRGGVTIPFLESEPLPLIEAHIDGHTANLFLDTGAPDVVLDPDFVREVGATIVGGREGTFAGGRTAQVRDATVHSVEIGPIALHELKVSVLPTRGMHLYKSRVVDGIIGTVFLSRFLSTVDFPGHRLLLQPRRATMAVRGTSTVVPMWLVGDHYVFAMGSINNLEKQLFFVDSGSTSAGFIPEAGTVEAAGIALTAPPREGIGGGGAVRVIPVIADRLCIGNACQERVPGTYSPDGSPLRFPFKTAGIVTNLYLRHYRVTFDFARMKLALARP